MKNRKRHSERRPSQSSKFGKNSEKKPFQEHQSKSGKGSNSRQNESGRSPGRGRSEKHRERFDREGGGRRPEGFKRYVGRVEKNRKGFAFIVLDGKEFEDIFVPEHEAGGLFHGDRIEIRADSRGQVLGYRVLEHRFKEIVGKLEPSSGAGRAAHLVYERKNSREDIFLPSGAPGANPGDYVRAKLTFHERGPYQVTGEVIEVIGPELTARYDVETVAAEYGLVEEHPEDAEREAERATLELSGSEFEWRTDLRHVPFITIDGETARDFDDAVFVEKNGQNYLLWVAIADVSHYVRQGSALDQDARGRSTSVYFPERAFHMLPRALSENLCSLRPNEPRFAMTAKIKLDRTGTIVSTELFESLIESRRRATYEEIQSEYEANQQNPDWEFAPHFELYKILRKSRSERGSIDFDLPEPAVLVDEQGEPTEIVNRERKDSHRLIEEFMIRANEAVTEWIMRHEWPFVYRIHEAPSYESIVRFSAFAKSMGVKLDMAHGEVIEPKAIAEWVRTIEDHPAAPHLNSMLLRSMKQAIYTNIHDIHFGLASEAYTHFTSPIRRYPDLLVHRILRHALRVEKRLEPRPNDSQLKELDEDLAKACEHSSYRERLAADAERESIKLKQTRLMARHLGEEFDGTIVGMVENGLFVALDSPYVEGMVSKETLTDDFYEFNEERMIFYGRRKKRTFKMGDRVRVVVVKANIDRRQIDFDLRSGGSVAEHGERSEPREQRDIPRDGRKYGKPEKRNQRRRHR